MCVDQVVTGQVHRGVMHGVDEAGLHHGVVGVLHRIGRVDHIHLDDESKSHTKCSGPCVRACARALQPLTGGVPPP